MKQTNSAIKFLMAQYRAIFKNANLKMFLAATAAAVALSSGAAQAAPAGTNVDPTPSYGDVLKDSVLSEGEVITQSGNTFTTFDAPAGKPVVINGGKLVITKDAASRIFTGRDLVLNSGSIELTGTETQKDVLNGLVGADKDTATGTDYNHSLTVNGGKVNVTSSFIQMESVTLNGGETTLGGNIGKKMGSSAAPGFFDYSAIHASEGTLTVGGSAVVNLNPASGIYGNYVNINGGTINFNGTSKANGAASDNKSGSYIRAGNPFLNTTLAINGGTLNVNEGKFGGIHGTIVEMNGGVLNVNGELTIGTNIRNDSVAEQAPKLGTVVVKGGDVNIGAKGTMIIDGNASFADGTLNNTGTIQVKSIPAGEQRSLTIGAHDFNNSFLKAQTAKLEVSGSAPSNSESERFDLVVTGNETLDLIGSGFLTADGALSDKVKFDASLENSTLTAENASLAAAQYSGKTDIDVGALTAGKDGKFEIKGNAEVTVDHGLTITPNEGKAQVTVAGQLWIDGRGGNVNADVIVNKDASDSSPVNFGAHEGTWNIKGLTLTSGTATFDGPTTVINLGGNLTTTTNGTLNIQDGATVNASAGDLNLVAEKVALTAGSTLTLDSADVFTLKNDQVTLVTAGDSVKSTFAKDAVTSDETSILNLKYNGEVTVANLEAIKAAIATDTKFKGFLKLEGASIKDRPTADTDLANVKAGYDGIYNNVAIKVGTGGAVNKSFTAGQIKLSDAADSKAAISADKTVMLTGSKGDFVVKSGGGVADVSLDSGSALVLAGNGSIGSITAAGAGSGSVVIGHSSLGHGTVNAKAIGGSQAVESLDVLNSNLNVDGAVKTESLDLIGGSALKITAKAGSGSITTESLDVSETSSIHAAGQAITVGTTANTTEVAEILGNVTAESLTFVGSGEHVIAGNATVDLDKLDLGTGTGANVAKLAVGVDAPDANGSATVITKSLVGTGTLIIDPVYSQKAALVIADSLKDPSTSTPETNDAGTLAGSAVVGNNSSLGIGFKSEAELNGVIGQFLNGHGAFTENPGEGEIANALVLNKKITVADTKGILLQKGATTSSQVAQNTVTLGGGTAIIITDKAFGDTKTDAAITLSNTTSNTVEAEGGEVILSGKFDAKDQLQIFSGANLSITKGDVVVKTSNGLLSGVISKTGQIGKVEKLNLDEDVVRAQFAGVSAPVQDLLVDTLYGEYKTKKGLGTEFVYNIAGTSLTGVELDAAVHAATFAGAQQAAVAAVGTMADAIGGRVGSLGAEASAIAATGSQANGGVWLSPMYKSVDADGFNAQGATYGADVDLAGVAFGVDTVNGDMRFGAVFNIGSGDSDGKGNGSGLKDEFDYYGFGIYSVMGFGQLALVGDASLNVISHDVEGFGLKGSADTTAITLGLTGQYAISTPMVDVVPHAGMRFTRLDTDSYDVNGAKGTLANTDFDVQNVFSIPLGVTLSKAFEMGGWALAPSADFTLTFNTGDTEVDSTTHLKDMTNLSLNTEVLDEVTYGINLGLGAQFGTFGAAFGLNYTGSENTDAFGVNANARYMF